MKPYLKYPGGKAKYVPLLETYYGKYRDRRFVAPFCGGLGDVLGLMPERALLNDSFPALINLHRWVQKGFFNFNWIFYNVGDYYKKRDRFNEITRSPEELKANSKEAAELLYFLNRHCFNGLMRCCSKGKFNSPVGKPSQEGRGYEFREHLLEYADVLAPWEFACGDFEQIKLQDDDFIYADPPYDLIGKGTFTQYGIGVPFKWEDQVRVAEWLAKSNLPVLASNHATPGILELYKDLGFKFVIFEKSRPMNCRGDRRSVKVAEMLAFRNIEI